ncbi:hypothetical protein SAY87_023402 [Trapa incisa]|uniref:Autophagy-related protein 9 n=1 Tax=Trapa incisa TaxID=236973 RepID=A0AAN7QS36_9MYRT|nr:hypothetical protein SAY87_023402 [Trapa incisa]
MVWSQSLINHILRKEIGSFEAVILGGQKGTSNFSKFKWNWPGDLSLTKGLLRDMPPEIELSEYKRIPSSGSESPSALLNRERISVEPIADLDLSFEWLYSYYCIPCSFHLVLVSSRWDLSPLRNENYLIGMVNKVVLELQISSWVPGAGPAVDRSDGRQRRPILAKTLE